jgi:hypothetical protein
MLPFQALLWARHHRVEFVLWSESDRCDARCETLGGMVKGKFPAAI